MRFSTWNVRSLDRSGALTTVARKLVRYILDLVGVQEVSQDKGDNVRAGDYTFFFCEKESENQQLETELFTPQNNISNSESRVCW